MKIFLLIIVVTTVMFPPVPPAQYIITQSAEEAAVLMWQHENKPYNTKYPDRSYYYLYAIDLEENTIKPVEIPKIDFQEAK